VETEKRDKKLPVVFPFFMALFPIIHLFDVNIGEVTLSEVTPTIYSTLFVVTIGWCILWAMTKNVRKSGLIVSILMLLFSFYYTYSGWIIQIVLVLLISNWLIFFIMKSQSDFRALVVFLNVASFVAVVVPGYSITKELLNPPSMEVEGANSTLSDKQKDMIGKTPNIYFIILDGYGGQKALKEFYRFPNTGFVDFLEEEGFWVSKASRSNYMRTVLSLPSTLNMEYLDEFIETNDLEESDDMRPAMFYLRWNYVKGFLQNFGYDTVGISSGFAGWDMIGADHFLEQKSAGMNQFRTMLHNHTPIFPLIREMAMNDPFTKHRELQIQTIAEIPNIPDMFDVPIFTFAHILCPHPPFVFGMEGELVKPKESRFHLGDGNYLVGASMDISQYRADYSKQLNALNALVMGAITELRENDPGAIIILQGDHGPGAELVWSSAGETNHRERSSILNAIYLPNQDYDDLYDSLSSVNTFRIIFNKYFGAEHKILPDRHFFSESGKPFRLLEMTFEDEQPVGKSLEEAISE
jgi:hypothetical protein